MATRRRERRVGKAPQKRRRAPREATDIDRRAASIPPGAVHELFDTSSIERSEPPAPSATTRTLHFSKPPPPPRPLHASEAEPPSAPDLELEPESVPELAAPLLTPPPVDLPSHPPRPKQRPRTTALLALAGMLALAAGVLVMSRGQTPDEPPTRVSGEPVAAMVTTVSAPPSPGEEAAADSERLAVSETELPADSEASAPKEARPQSEGEDAAEPGAEPAVAASPSPAVLRARASAAAAAVLPPFDADAAGRAIAAAFSRARSCRKADDPVGAATATITYAPSGRITSATITGPFAGTATGGCIAATLRSAKVPPFSGDYLTVKRTAFFE